MNTIEENNIHELKELNFKPLPEINNQNMTIEASKLLDFNQSLDIALLDNVISCLYNGIGDQQRIAQEVLTTLKGHPDAWTRVDAILEYSKNQQTKYYALQILEEVISTRWKVLPKDQCEGIKKYIVNVIIKTSSTQELLEKEKVYLGKLNMILVQILKKEWPKNWSSFIPDIVGASKASESMCQNNMTILKLLSEEVFDFSTNQMTQTKAKHLKDTMCSEFQQVFMLCIHVMDNSQNPTLVSATLETLLRFLNWIPLGYIFETKLINTLIFKFLSLPLFRNVTLKCLTEIAGVSECQYDEEYIAMFTLTIEKLEEMLPLETNIKKAYSNGTDAEQEFIQNLALYLCSYFKDRGSLIEKKKDVLIKGLQYLILISEVEDTEVFKICLEYWCSLAADLYRETPVIGTIGSSASFFPKPSLRKQFYQPILSKLRELMISRMARPEEVLVVENDQGEVVREFMKDTDAINMYKNMKETLVYLTHLDYNDTEKIMTHKLNLQVNGAEWSWKNLNTLCWAVGSISGAFPEEDEKRFLVVMIKELLGLCEQKRGKDNKAIIASNIMYIVGQYPRFLRIHWRFLKTVINKLFEFMHETHEGVQDMACDTFIKIAQKCKRQFTSIQIGEATPFIEEILGNINSIICDLQPQQVHTFYEAVGYMISSQLDTNMQHILIEKYMMLPNQVWDEIMAQAAKNVDTLKEPDVVKQLANILKTNVRACKAVGHPFLQQIGKIYLDMLNVYKVMSENVTAAITINGEVVTKQPLIKGMRVVKKESLKLITVFISKCEDHTVLLNVLLQPFFDVILVDYQRTPVPAGREPEVLSTLAALVNKLKAHITSDVPKMFDAVFECTLSMINKDFEEFPEHRTNFFLFLQEVNSCCFPALMSILPEQFKLVLDSIIWAFKHTMRNVADTGLNILHQLLLNIFNGQNDKGCDPVPAGAFARTYFADIMQHLFSVVTDSSHTAGLMMHATILSYMFSIVEAEVIKVSLNSNKPDASPSENVEYIQTYVANLLKAAFPHLTDNQIKITVKGFIDLNHDISLFKDHLRDFIIQIREFTGDDDSDLFLEEREVALKQAQEAKRHNQMSVPGMINPHELPDNDDM